MKALLLIFALLSLLTTQLFGKENEDAAIVAAAETYLKANAQVTTEVKYIVEQIEGDLARVRINPADKPTKSTAWIFLRKKDGKWTGISARGSFSAEEYERLGIPKSLRIPD